MHLFVTLIWNNCPQLYWWEVGMCVCVLGGGGGVGGELGFDGAYLILHAISADLVVDLHIYGYCIPL